MKCRPENEADAAAYTESGADAVFTMSLKLPVNVTLLFVTRTPISLLPGPNIRGAAEVGMKVTPAVTQYENVTACTAASGQQVSTVPELGWETVLLQHLSIRGEQTEGKMIT
jgi:hypothetical protein